jgi:alpha-beta hydrolase superfamily lysophospholipase
MEYLNYFIKYLIKNELHKTKSKKLTIMGHSMGGFVALNFLYNYYNKSDESNIFTKIDKLILLNSPINEHPLNTIIEFQ